MSLARTPEDVALEDAICAASADVGHTLHSLMADMALRPAAYAHACLMVSGATCESNAATVSAAMEVRALVLSAEML